jgi:SAM-dependent methyltransferase
MAVASEPSLAWYVDSGARDAARLRDLITGAGIEVSGDATLLDHGCGCGRLTRRLAGWPHAALLATDHDERAIRWCRDNLPIADFRVNDLRPPLPVAAAAVDIAIAWSVFTHLDEDLCTMWLDELDRVLAPDGCLLLTSHGRAYRPHLSRAERARFDAGQMVVRRPRGVGTNLCAAFHPPDRLRALLDHRFCVLAHQEGDLRDGRLQDAWLVRRQP